MRAASDRSESGTEIETESRRGLKEKASSLLSRSRKSGSFSFLLLSSKQQSVEISSDCRNLFERACHGRPLAAAFWAAAAPCRRRCSGASSGSALGAARALAGAGGASRRRRARRRRQHWERRRATRSTFDLFLFGRCRGRLLQRRGRLPGPAPLRLRAHHSGHGGSREAHAGPEERERRSREALPRRRRRRSNE